ncbi:Tyrosine-protein phosphatase 10D [Portunus trituberculatus]|uniref:Tyrosine-protein phosphatase 10D n=1 Tax=Portunus trituberculatus TaxID=210409 RepID=A0A5B7FSL2_PORTR|nr:Tyrosine-protein phosphatase 10D [Portunus trituberculatus]
MRSISHFQFESWPDMGCPDTPDQLIKFVKAVKEAVPAQSAHVVVHCRSSIPSYTSVYSNTTWIKKVSHIFHMTFLQFYFCVKISIYTSRCSQVI